MSTAKDDEDFWFSSEKRFFSFDSNEVDQLFEESKNDMDKLCAGISNSSISEGSLNNANDCQTLQPMLSIILEKTLSCILPEDKLQKEHTETAATQPDITLTNILLGQPYSLEQYKTLASKTALLDAAILSGDGNAILIIILFLTKTLKRSLVQRILSERPDAVNVYIHYLSINLQINDITDILSMLGQSTDAAMKCFHIIIKNTQDPEQLLQKLKNCYKTQFSSLADLKETLFVQSYVTLLEWQLAVKRIKDSDELELNSSALEFLRYACKMQHNKQEGTLISPAIFSQEHDISPGQYQRVMLEGKAAIGEWDSIDSLLFAKGWLGNKKLQSHLPIEDIIKILHKNNAPLEMLEKYLRYVDNIQKRLELANTLHCFKIVIDILVQQADRAALIQYKNKLQEQSGEYFYAESALRLPSVKWKN